jgi:Fic/DOC family
MAAKSDVQGDHRALTHLIGAAAQGGLSLAQISRESNMSMTRRTLIRRLNALVESGDIRKTGVGRGAKYFGISHAAPEPTLPKQTELFMPLSKASSAIIKQVTGPLGSRKPVGYDRAFLNTYRPNQTGYLTTAEKARLADLGITSMPTGAAGTYAQHILQRLLIDLSWNSSRLEGNTYSLLDTQRLIELGESTEGKAPTDAQMILNHKAAIEFLVQSAADIAFDRRTILNLHALLADNLLSDPSAPGRLRSKGVGISGSVFHPLGGPAQIEDAFNQILATATAIRDPFEQALFAMVQLPYLQPFDDVNKRVSRLAANIPLIRNNLAPLSFVDVPDETYALGMLGVYELNRVDLIKDVFLWAYERSAQRYAAIRQTLGNPDPFRLRHRNDLKLIVSDVVRRSMTTRQAARHIAEWTAANIAEQDRAKFVEIAETELMALHEGNFARYQIRPSEFDVWQRSWAQQPSKSKSSKS